MSDEKTFANGFVFKRNANAPSFVIGRMSIKVEDAVAFMEEHEKNGWVNLDIKQARGGNYYVELDTFVRQEATVPVENQDDTSPEAADDDLPF